MDSVALPEEVLLQIFSYLEIRDLGLCARINQVWRRLSEDSGLWKTLLQRDFPRALTTSLDCKNQYRARAWIPSGEWKSVQVIHECVDPFGVDPRFGGTPEHPLVGIADFGNHLITIRDALSWKELGTVDTHISDFLWKGEELLVTTHCRLLVWNKKENKTVTLIDRMPIIAVYIDDADDTCIVVESTNRTHYLLAADNEWRPTELSKGHRIALSEDSRYLLEVFEYFFRVRLRDGMDHCTAEVGSDLLDGRMKTPFFFRSGDKQLVILWRANGEVKAYDLATIQQCTQNVAASQLEEYPLLSPEVAMPKSAAWETHLIEHPKINGWATFCRYYDSEVELVRFNAHGLKSTARIPLPRQLLEWYRYKMQRREGQVPPLCAGFVPATAMTPPQLVLRTGTGLEVWQPKEGQAVPSGLLEKAASSERND